MEKIILSTPLAIKKQRKFIGDDDVKRTIMMMCLAILLIGCQNEAQTNEQASNTTDGQEIIDDSTGAETVPIEGAQDEIDSEENESQIEESLPAKKEDQEIGEETASDEPEERAKIEEVIQTSSFETDLVEDNKEKRVILIKDASGKETHKSIFIKSSKRLKIIEFNKGQIFNEVI